MHSTAPPVLPAYSLSDEHLGPNEPDTIDLAAIIRFIRKGWRLCLTWIFVGLCAGVAFTMLTPAYYTAFATILLEDRASRAPTELANAEPAVDQAFTDSQIEDLRSDEVIRRVVHSDRLAEVDELGTAGVRLQSGQGHRNGFVIAVAAPTGGAGASSVAVHLARINAECGQKTVLADANWRNHTVDQALLEPNAGRGLATGLAVINIGLETLDVLLLRPRTTISELNASLSIAAALHQLQGQYDCVVVDFHSADRTADFEANMTAINEAIVVVEARRTSSECLTGFLRLIPGNKVVAVVLNKA